MKLLTRVAVSLGLCLVPLSALAAAADCPEGGKVRIAAVPAEDTAELARSSTGSAS